MVESSLELLKYLEAMGVQEALKEEAYQNVKAKYRTCLKEAIALAHWHFNLLYPRLWPNFSLSDLNTTLKSQHQGMGLNLKLRPLDWLIILIPENYLACARLTAAAIFPQLCGIKNIYAVFLENLLDPKVLISLDLTGIEDCLILKKDQVNELVNYLKGNGGILALSESMGPFTAPILFQESPLRICIHDSKLFDLELIKFLHGDLPLYSELDENTDLLITSKSEAKYLEKEKFYPNLLVVTQGCEGYWRYRELNPQLFTIEQKLIYTLDEED